MNSKETINNLVTMSHTLEQFANRPENYNTEWAQYLEQMSWSLYKHANELRDIESLYRISTSNAIMRG